MEKKNLEKGQYRVRTKGFSMIYSDLDKAEKEFEALKQKKLKEEESFYITLEQRLSPKDSWAEIDSVRITESYYA